MKIYYTPNKDTVFFNGKFTSKKKTFPSYAFSSAFSGCTNLTSVSFPNLTSAEASAFYFGFSSNNYLTSVSFPELTSVGGSTFSYAFSGCTNLTSVSFPKLTSAKSGAFNYIGHSNLTIHVPSSLSSAGLSTDGSEYGTIVYDL